MGGPRRRRRRGGDRQVPHPRRRGGTPSGGRPLVDLTVWLTEPATAAQVNAAFHTAAEAQLKGILRCTEEPVVSHDVIGENASCLLDTGLTGVAGRMVTVFGWYDNEWGYAQRTVDLVEMVARLLPAR